MYSFIPEELTWARVAEHELEARRTASRASRRSRGRSLRGVLARKLVQTGLRLDERAGDVALKPAAKGGRCSVA